MPARRVEARREAIACTIPADLRRRVAGLAESRKQPLSRLVEDALSAYIRPPVSAGGVARDFSGGQR